METKQEIQMTLVAKKEFRFLNRNGNEITGITYGGYTDQGAWLAFSSKNESYDIYPQNRAFVEDESEPITLYRKLDIYTGKEKWRDYSGA